MERSINEIVDNGEENVGWVENGCFSMLVYTEWKFWLNIDAILCGKLACADLLSGLLVLVIDTELGTLPELYRHKQVSFSLKNTRVLNYI